MAIEERKAESGVQSDPVAPIALPPPADELRNLLLVVVDLAESEEVSLADLERELAHRVAEQKGKIRLDILQRIDAKTVHVPVRDGILVAADQCRAHLRQSGDE